MTGAAPSVSPETAAAGGSPPDKPVDALLRRFHHLIDARHARLAHARHARLAHARTHLVGQVCPQCQVLITADAIAQEAYTAAWQEMFAPGQKE